MHFWVYQVRENYLCHEELKTLTRLLLGKQARMYALSKIVVWVPSEKNLGEFISL